MLSSLPPFYGLPACFNLGTRRLFVTLTYLFGRGEVTVYYLAWQQLSVLSFNQVIALQVAGSEKTGGLVSHRRFDVHTNISGVYNTDYSAWMRVRQESPDEHLAG